MTSTNQPIAEAATCHIRWMIRRDMPEVISIENECFPNPWDEEEFLQRLRQRNCIAMVAEIQGRIVGYMVYELHKSYLMLISIAVSKCRQRRGIGWQMIAKLVGKLNPLRRKRILLEVRESNLPAHLFLRNNGFKAVSVLRDACEDTGEDAYVFEYRLGQ